MLQNFDEHINISINLKYLNKLPESGLHGSAQCLLRGHLEYAGGTLQRTRQMRRVHCHTQITLSQSVLYWNRLKLNKV